MRLGVYSIGVVKQSERSKNIPRGGSYCFSAGTIDGTKMSATGRISFGEKGFRCGNLLISGQLMKCEDHG